MVSELQLHSPLGKYNVTYQDVDEQRVLGRNPIRRHVSDAAYCAGAASRKTLKRSCIVRHDSDSATKESNDKSCIPSISSRTLLLQNYSDSSLVTAGSRRGRSLQRAESDLRKKRVAFADTATIMPSRKTRKLNREDSINEHVVLMYTNDSPLSESRTTDGLDRASASAKDIQRTNKEKLPESRELTPKERRRRKVVMAVICTTFVILAASALFVLITLYNASAIDEAVRKENEGLLRNLSSASSNSSSNFTAETEVWNVTTPP